MRLNSHVSASSEASAINFDAFLCRHLVDGAGHDEDRTRRDDRHGELAFSSRHVPVLSESGHVHAFASSHGQPPDGHPAHQPGLLPPGSIPEDVGRELPAVATQHRRTLPGAQSKETDLQQQQQ